MTVEKFTVTRHDEFMEGWPDIVRCKNGDLLVFYNECNGHIDRNHSYITMRRSRDNGRTWSEEKTHIGGETSHGKHWNSIRASVSEDGRIILVCDKMNGTGLTAESAHTCRVYMWESFDNGETFVNMRNTEIVGFCTDKVRFLPDGSWLILVSLKNLENGKFEIHAHKSCNDGKTWEYKCIAAADERYNFIEPNTLQLSDGRLIAFLREDSKLGYNGFACISEDGGESFGDIFEIPVPGMHRPFLQKMTDGRIILSYREFLNGGYRNLKMCVMTEEELLKAEKYTTYHIDTDRAEKEDQGYSAWVQTANNDILLVNYITDDAPKPYIRGYRITL